MKRSSNIAMAAGLLLAAAVGCSAKDETTRIKADQLPEAVRASLEEKAAGGEIDEIEKRVRDGQTSYRAEYTSGTDTVIVRLDAKGKVTSTKMDDKAVKLEDLPGDVRATVERELKGGTIEALERSGDKPGTYEVVMKIDGRVHELRIDTGGRIVERN